MNARSEIILPFTATRAEPPRKTWCRIGACSRDSWRSCPWRRWPPLQGSRSLRPRSSAPAPTATAQRSPRNASYTIAARLDPASRTIKGEQLLTWRNTSASAATTLRFHLYYNAWRNTRSTWIRERILAGDTDIITLPESDWGWIDLTTVKIVGAAAPTDVTSKLRFIAPDDGNTEDRTVAEIPLDQPVAPGQTINVQMAWSSRVPRTFARTGTIGNYYFLAQWFPKIGVLQDVGWNCHQFHAATEFFSDYGVYDVRLTVPNGWVVGATGLEQSRRDEGDGTTTHHYHADDVHDFAWTTSPDYIERTARFGHPSLPPVAMRLLLQPEHRQQTERHLRRDPRGAQVLRRMVRTVSVPEHHHHRSGVAERRRRHGVSDALHGGQPVDRAPQRRAAGGRHRSRSRTPVLVRDRRQQRVRGRVDGRGAEHVLHGRGRWSSSSSRTTMRSGTSAGSSRGSSAIFRCARATDGNRLTGYRAAAKSDAQSTPTWRYFPGTAGAITYNKTALWLNTLERMLGWDTLQRIMSTFFTRYAFKHPRPEDFFATVNEVSGRDLTWFFDEVYRGSNVFDYGVDSFTSERASDRGYFGDASRQAYSASEGSSDSYRTTLVVRRFGEAVFPVDVRIVFENNQDVRWRWDGRDRWKLFEVERPLRAVTAQVDPERVLLLDVNYTNNSKSLAPKSEAAARKWSLAWLIWLQDHLLTYGFFV